MTFEQIWARTVKGNGGLASEDSVRIRPVVLRSLMRKSYEAGERAGTEREKGRTGETFGELLRDFRRRGR